MDDNFDELCEKLQYRFADPKLLKLALTHRSKGSKHNERLEFLGDSIVNCVIAEALFKQFPQATEGELSRWRAVLVNRESLGDLAKHFDLGAYLYLGPGELKSGGDQRPSILSCAMEAVVGSIYLDSGFERTRTTILQWYEAMLQTLSSAASHKDPKTILQEYVQAKHLALPLYAIEEVQGAAHKQVFIISCSVEGLPEKTLGKGTSRRRAEQAAAEAMLGVLGK
jgi:ribonuclease III